MGNLVAKRRVSRAFTETRRLRACPIVALTHVTLSLPLCGSVRGKDEIHLELPQPK